MSLTFTVHYEDTSTPIVFELDSHIIELKYLISDALQIDFNSISLFVERYGQIDTEDLIELPITVLSLPQNVNINLFVLDMNKKEMFYKLYCSRKFAGFNPLRQLGFRLDNGAPICLACSIFCRKGQYSFDTAIVGQDFICKCGNLPDKQCVYCDMTSFERKLNVSLPNIKAILEQHSEALLKYENEKKIEELSQAREREFDFENSIKFGLQRVREYDDEETIKKVHSLVPKRDDGMSDHDYVKKLLYWFKNDFFTWCNKPKCSQCHNNQDNMISIGTEISSEEEQRWLASRTEVYQCIECDLIARFPRYNSPYKLLETRTGRCGEYANTFGCILNACGFKVRFVDNFEDHVWNEFYSETEKRWIHVDSCENAFDTPLLYEQGWGRVMTFILAHSTEEIVDVTPRYIKCWELCQERRSKENEDKLKELLEGMNISLAVNLSQEKQKEIEERHNKEQKELNDKKGSGNEVKEAELIGRQSGSVEWRKERGEFKK